jgi:hypothetical protein
MDPVELAILFAERGWIRWLPLIATSLLFAVNKAIDGRRLEIHSTNKKLARLGFSAPAFVLEEEEGDTEVVELRTRAVSDLTSAIGLPAISTVADVFALLGAFEIIRRGHVGWYVNPKMPSVLDLPLSDSVRQQEEAMVQLAKHDSLCARIVGLFAHSRNGKHQEGFQNAKGITSWTTSLISAAIRLEVKAVDVRKALRTLKPEWFSCVPDLETLEIDAMALFIVNWQNLDEVL